MTPAPRTRRTLAALSPLLLLSPLAACGIQKSDVVEAGGAATVAVQPTGGTKLLLFLVGPSGQVMPVTRDLGLAVGPNGETSLIEGPGGVGRVVPTHPTVDGGYRVAPDKVLGLLLEGPDEQERAAGLTSRLALHGAGAPHIEAQRDPSGSPFLHLRLSARVQDVDPVAVQQLVCTAVFAEELGSGVPVVVAGTDGALPPTDCDSD
ncbi:hypothetical protein ACIGO8_22925 [Streptomyces sp. NPDC053493]|uniref:hypothetical protein n=1 Tax=Streptomyces sp. NPDC053493 TaxID=3365705 RepID=UPI0037CF3828